MIGIIELIEYVHESANVHVCYLECYLKYKTKQNKTGVI